MKCIKVAHPTAKHAYKALTKLKEKFPTLARYYLCPNCGAYHLTSQQQDTPAPIHTPEMTREVKQEYVESKTYSRARKLSLKRKHNRAFWK